MERHSPTLGRRPSPQTVNDALLAATDAFRDHKEIDVDANGTLQPGRAVSYLTSLQTLFSRLYYKRTDASETLLQKMIGEVSTRMNIDSEHAASIITKRVGSLSDIRQAIVQHDLTQIEDRWSRLATELSNHQEEMRLINRNRELEDIKQVMPRELELSNLDGYVSELKREFSKNAQARILEAYDTLANDSVDAEHGLAPQFVKDAHRATFIFVDQHGIEQTYSGAPNEAVIAALRSFANDDQAVAACLSKLINQRALAGVYVELHFDFPTPTGGPHAAPENVIKSNRSSHETSIYKLERDARGGIIITSDYYHRPHKLQLLSSNRGVPVNRWQGWDQDAGPDNFGSHCHCALRVTETLLKANRMDATYVAPPYAEFRYQIAWDLIEGHKP